MEKLAYFKSSSSVIQGSANVDLTSRNITSVIVLERGKVKDSRDILIDDEFATSLFKSAKGTKGGIICNFGHNWDNLGKRLGRFTNFTDDGKTIRADLSIYDAADASPSLPGLGSYVLQLAEEDPNVIMSSISFSYKYQYQLDGSGNEIVVNYYDKESGWVSPIKEYGEVRMKFDKLISIDLVDEGAATNSLFSYKDSSYGLGDLIDEATLSKISKQGDKPSVMDAFKALFGLGTSDHSLTSKLSEVNNPNNQEGNPSQPPATDNPDTNAAFSKMIEIQNAALTSLTETIESLKKRLEKIESSPAADHSKGDEDNNPEEKLKAYELNPINQKWLNNRKK